MVNFFIERPIFAASIAILMTLAGLIAYLQLPVAEFPDVVPPQVQVTAQYIGASAQGVADAVTTPLETQINGVQGMIYSSSVSSSDGSSSITVTFNIGYPVDIGAVDTQNRTSAATGQLPALVNQTGVAISKQNPNFVMAVNLFSPDSSIDPVTMSNYAYLQLVDELKRLPGVSDVRIFGERRYAIRIWLDPDKLADLGLTAIDVKNAVSEQNQLVAAGQLGEAPAPPGTTFRYQINAQGQLLNAQQFGNIVVRTAGAHAAPVYLRDVARIELGALQYTQSGYVNKLPAVLMAVFQLPSANALTLDRNVRSTMGRLALRFPHGMSWGIAYDTTLFVSASMNEVMKTLGIALLLVIAVVYIFLQSWRATIIPAVAIPVSLIATFAVMLAIGFSLNTLSLLGMVLAIGLVVDDAIVVVENAQRQLDNGLAPMAAAKAAMREVTGPIIATSAVLGAVFVPIAFIPGITGRLYNQFAVTIAISVAFSAFNSLTLSPALCAVLLRRERGQRFVLFRKFNQGFEWTRHFYSNSVQDLIRYRWIALALFALGLGVTYALFEVVPSAFIPSEDSGYFFVITSLPNGASLERTDAVLEQERNLVLATPGVATVMSVSGLNFVTRATNSYSGAMFVILKPWSDRGSKLTADRIVAGLQPKLSQLPQALILALNPPSIRGVGTFGGFDFEIENLTGNGSAALEQATNDFLAAARRQKEIDARTLISNFNTHTPQYNFDLDRNKAKQLGLNLSDVFDTMQIYLGSLYVNNVTLFGRPFEVLLEADNKARANISDLSRLYTRNAAGGMVPLSTLARLTPSVGPDTVPHYNLYQASEVTGSAAPGYSSGQAISAMERAARQALPSGFGYEWTGLSYQELQAGAVEGLVFALSLVFVFLFLAAQYESWTMPFMIILAVPLALFGALLLLWLRGIQMDVYAQVGFVLLVGLAAKNAILIVEFARRRREAGLSIVQAAREAAQLRLRPILMTALAFILGATPLMLASGAGAASRVSIGTTVVGGMLAATILSLGFVPIFYAVIERARERLWHGRPIVQAAAHGSSEHSGATEAERHGPQDDSGDDDFRRRVAHMTTARRSTPGARRPASRARSSRKAAPSAHRRPLSRSQRRWLSGCGIATAAMLILLASVSALRGRSRSEVAEAATRQAAPPAPQVPVAAVVEQTVPVYVEYVGTTDPIRNVTLEAQVTGYLVRHPVADGANVKRGELLYQIDPRAYRAALDQARAQADRDAAAHSYAAANHRRDVGLSKTGDVSLDTLQQASSSMQQEAAAQAADRAAIESAQLNLGYTSIRAPFAGRLSLTLVHEGSLITVAGTQLNTLVQLDPIYATFNPPESDLAGIEQAQKRGAIPAEILVGQQDKPSYTGKLTFLDNNIDRTTGTITARATVANPDRTLLPGQFIHVRLHLADQPNALLLPQVAVTPSQLGSYVLVLGPGNRVEQQYVTLGAQYGALEVVTHGVTAGQYVLTGGLLTVHPGMLVRPVMQTPHNP